MVLFIETGNKEGTIGFKGGQMQFWLMSPEVPVGHISRDVQEHKLMLKQVRILQKERKPKVSLIVYPNIAGSLKISMITDLEWIQYKHKAYKNQASNAKGYHMDSLHSFMFLFRGSSL